MGSAAVRRNADPKVASYDKGTPVARPVRKAKDLNSETAWPSKREFGLKPFTFLRYGSCCMKKFFAVPLAVLFVAACSESTNPVSTDLDVNYGKPVAEPPEVCSSCPVRGTFTFESGTTVSSAGSGGASVGTDIQPDVVASASGPTVVTAPNGQDFLGRFEETRTMVTINAPAGSSYNLNFDLYIIGSWDGRGKQAQSGAFDANVVDIGYRCSPTGVTTSLMKTTFSNQLTVQQDYPLPYLQGGNKAGTGAEFIDALGYKGARDVNGNLISNTPVFRSFGDAIYNMTFSGANPCGGAGIQFTISTSNPRQQSTYDESWGVDNVIVRTQ